MDGEAMNGQPNLRERIGVIRTTHHEADPCARIIEAWAYGEVRECETCDGSGFSPTGKTTQHYGHKDDVYAECPTCHGTGEVRGPGLVERVIAASNEASMRRLGTVKGYELDALEAELGTP